MDKKTDKILLDVFKGDKRATYIYKKTKRVVSAVYMVADTMSDREILKDPIRDTALAILRDITDFFSHQKVPTDYFLEGVTLRFVKVRSFLEVGVLAGALSDMNFRLLVKSLAELYLLVKEVGEARRAPESAPLRTDLFSEGFFEVVGEDSDTEISTRADMLERLEKAVQKDQSKIPPPSSAEGDVFYGTPSPPQRAAPPGAPSQPTQAARRAARAERGRGRRAIILSALAQSGRALPITDVAAHLSGVSTKTVQRELLALEADGLVAREGAKRWTTYALTAKGRENAPV